MIKHYLQNIASYIKSNTILYDIANVSIKLFMTLVFMVVWNMITIKLSIISSIKLLYNNMGYIIPIGIAMYFVWHRYNLVINPIKKVIGSMAMVRDNNKKQKLVWCISRNTVLVQCDYGQFGTITVEPGVFHTKYDAYPIYVDDVMVGTLMLNESPNIVWK